MNAIVMRLYPMSLMMSLLISLTLPMYLMHKMRSIASANIMHSDAIIAG